MSPSTQKRRKTTTDARRRKRMRKSSSRPIALQSFRSILDEESSTHEPRLFYTSSKIDAAKMRAYNLTGGALEHLVWARQRSSPLQTEPTLPHSLLAAFRAHKDSEPKEINESRRRIMHFLRLRAQQLLPEADEMRSKMKEDVRAISGQLNLPLLRELILLTDYPDVELPNDLQKGMPVVGRLPHIKGVFGQRPPGEFTKKPNPFVDPKELLRSAMDRREEFLKLVSEQTFNSQIWDSCLAEVRQGLMEGPLSTSEALERYGKHVLASRFAVEQVDKTRFCDDYRRSGTNRSTEYSQSITLPTHETILAVWRLVASLNEEDPITIFKSDHESAYRQVPTNPEHSRFQLICVTGPDGRPAIFRHRALSFGASSSVWSYCRISQCLTHLHRILFGGISMSFIDDYWGIEPESTAHSSFESLTLLNELIGFREKESKRQAPATSTTLLGLKISFEDRSVRFALPEDKRLKLMTSLEEIHRTGWASTGDLKKLCGRLTFAAATSADHSWRSYTRSLYSWIFQGPRYASLQVNNAISNLLSLVRDAPPSRTVRVEPNEVKPFVLYSDAEGAQNRLGGVLCNPHGSSDKDKFFSETAPQAILESWQARKTQIVPLELLAAVTTLQTFCNVLQNKSCVIYVDSEPVEYALVKGSSRQEDLNRMVSSFWRIATRHNISIWVTRVPSKQNLADGPSRRSYEHVANFSRWPASRKYKKKGGKRASPGHFSQLLDTFNGPFSASREIQGYTSRRPSQTTDQPSPGGAAPPVPTGLTSPPHDRYECQPVTRPRDPTVSRLLTALQHGLPVAGILALNSHYSRLASVNTRTLRQYLSSLRSYMTFVDSMSIILGSTVPYFPTEVTILTTWISTFRNASTAANYVSALRKWCRVLGWEAGDLAHPMLSTALQGHANLHPGGLRRMKPIGLGMLRSLIHLRDPPSEPQLNIGVTVASQSYPAMVMRAAFVLSYWFLLRVPSELLTCRKEQLSLDANNATVLSLPRRKNSKWPVTLIRYCVCERVEPELCPHVHAQRLIGSSSSPNGPSPRMIEIPAKKLKDTLRAMLRDIGVSDVEMYGLHSFRRGHATDLAEQDISPATLLQMGGWRSAAFKVYINLPEVEARAAAKITVDESSDEED